MARYRARIRSSDLSDGSSALAGDPFKMYPPGLGTPNLFAMPAGTAVLCSRVDVTLRDFIPPLLLPCSPYLRRAASAAGEGLILVVAKLNETRRAVAVVRLQGRDVDADDTSRRTIGFSLALTTFLSGDHVSLVIRFSDVGVAFCPVDVR